MELAAQIKRYRKEQNLSQDELAERIFVSRQTVSNWETERTYPDIKSLVLLSEVFSVSLDQLIKGDLQMMKEEITSQERASFNRDSNIFTTLFVAMVFLALPLADWLGWWGIGLWAVLAVVTLTYGFRVEKYKKKFDIQSYREIIAFTQGKSLDEIEKAREAGKRPYQKVLAVLISALFGAAVAFVYIKLKR